MNLLCKANKSLKLWANRCLGYKKSREMRKILFDQKNVATLQTLELELTPSEIERFRLGRQRVIDIHLKSQPALCGRTVEWAMMCGYSALAHRQAVAWHAISSGQVDKSDFIQEAYMSLLDAIYSFTRRGVAFSTYAHCSIRNRLMAASNRTNPFRPLTNADLKLQWVFEKAYQRQLAAGPTTFDSVADSIGLDDEQRRTLRHIFALMVPESQLTKNVDAKDDMDYTVFRKEDRAPVVSTELVKEAIEKSGLTDFERKMVLQSLHPHHGWQAEVCKKAGCSRTWGSMALRSAHAKMREFLTR